MPFKYLQLPSTRFWDSLNLKYFYIHIFFPLEAHSEWKITAALDAVHLDRKRHLGFNWHGRNFASETQKLKALLLFVQNANQGEGIAATVH